MKCTLIKTYCTLLFFICFALFSTAQAAPPQVSYQAHISGYGWLNWVGNGKPSGTTGQNRRMEAIRIKANLPIVYQVHVSGHGWLNWVGNGDTAGTTGQNRRMEAIRIKINGQYAQRFDVYYRVHVSGYGWLNWVKNGAIAGTTGQSRQIEAIQIKFDSR